GVATGASLVPAAVSMPSVATKIARLTSPSMPSQFSSTNARSGSSAAVALQVASHPSLTNPLALVKPVSQRAMAHALSWQAAVACASMQGRMQPPQLLTSIEVSTQAPLQQARLPEQSRGIMHG